MSRNIRAVCKYFVENLSWRSPASGLQTPPTRNGFKQFSETSKNKVNRCGLFAAPAKPYVNNQVNRVSCQKLYTPICPSKLCASRYLWIRDSNFYSKVFSGVRQIPIKSNPSSSCCSVTWKSEVVMPNINSP